MIDNLFTAALTFCLLTAGTLSLGSKLFANAGSTEVSNVRVVQLERVVIVGKRTAPSAIVANADTVEPASRAQQ